MPFHPPLGNNKHGLVALSHTCLIAKYYAFLKGGSERKACSCDLKRVHLDAGRSINRQQLVAVRQSIQLSGGIIRLIR